MHLHCGNINVEHYAICRFQEDCNCKPLKFSFLALSGRQSTRKEVLQIN